MRCCGELLWETGNLKFCSNSNYFMSFLKIIFVDADEFMSVATEIYLLYWLKWIYRFLKRHYKELWCISIGVIWVKEEKLGKSRGLLLSPLYFILCRFENIRESLASLFFFIQLLNPSSHAQSDCLLATYWHHFSTCYSPYFYLQIWKTLSFSLQLDYVKMWYCCFSIISFLCSKTIVVSKPKRKS